MIINNIANLIDYTLLSPEATSQNIKSLCNDAKKHGFKTVCINPSRVKDAKDNLKSSLVQICSVVGFPYGANKKQIKLSEIDSCIRDGADEIDMVMNIGKFKDKDYSFVSSEIRDARKIVFNKVIKVIIETSLLSEHEIILATQLVEQSGADFIKTSTGVNRCYVNNNIVKLIKSSISSRIKIKASGGIKTYKQAQQLLQSGADRIGSSSRLIIMKK